MGFIKYLLMEIAEKAYPRNVGKQSEFIDLFINGGIQLWRINEKDGLVVNGKRFVWNEKKKKLRMFTCKRRKQVKIKD